MDRQAIEPVKKRNSINHQNSARLTRWLDSLAQFNISEHAELKAKYGSLFDS